MARTTTWWVVEGKMAVILGEWHARIWCVQLMEKTRYKQKQRVGFLGSSKLDPFQLLSMA
jgi:hypothetical protein